MLNSITLFGTLCIIEAFGGADEIARYSADPVKFYRNPPELFACVIFSDTVKFRFRDKAILFFLYLINLGFNKLHGDVIRINYFRVHGISPFLI